MRIVYILNQFSKEYQSEIEKSTLAIASAIQKNANNVKIITYSSLNLEEYTESYKGILYRKKYTGQLEVIEYRPATNASTHDNLQFDQDGEIEQFAEYILHREEPHIVHVMHTMNSGVFIKKLIKLKIPYVLTLSDFFLICPKSNLKTSAGKLCKGPQNTNECLKECPELTNDWLKERMMNAGEILYNARYRVTRSDSIMGIYQKEYPGLDFILLRQGATAEEVNRKYQMFGRDDKTVRDPEKNPENLNESKKHMSLEPLRIIEQEVYVYEKLYHMCI